MPFVRSSRGAKTQFNAVNISSTLSKAYAYVYGKNLVLHRSKIHEHTQNIIKDLEDKYGALMILNGKEFTSVQLLLEN